MEHNALASTLQTIQDHTRQDLLLQDKGQGVKNPYICSNIPSAALCPNNVSNTEGPTKWAKHTLSSPFLAKNPTSIGKNHPKNSPLHYLLSAQNATKNPQEIPRKHLHTHLKTCNQRAAESPQRLVRDHKTKTLHLAVCKIKRIFAV